MTNMAEKQKIQYLDMLRSIAMLGVIVNHVTSPVMKMMYGRNMEYWWIGNAIQSIFRFDIAIFLMLSGATMLGREYNLGEFYKKRFIRVFIPFLFWLVAYWVYRWLILSPKVQPHGFEPIFNWAVELFRKEGVSKHFWYMYMIMVLYFFVPFIGKMIRKLKHSQLPYVILIWLVLTVLFSTKTIKIDNWPYLLQKAKDYLLYTGFMVLGYFLVNWNFPAKKYRLLSAGVYLFTIVFTAIAVFVASKNAHKLDLRFFGSFSLNTITQAVAFVLLLKDSKISNRILIWLSETIGNYSFGIYLVHVMVISIFFNHGIFWTMAYPLISLPIVIILTLITSFTIIFVMRKIPGGKYISG